MMILSVAIVTATSLLVSLINANKTNVSSLQAYYLAQEGLEAVRNIRDTNWLNNVDWKKGNSNLFETELEKNYAYSITLEKGGWNMWVEMEGNSSRENTLVKAALPWSLVKLGGIEEIENDPYADGMALQVEEADQGLFGVSKGPSKFYRHINILPYLEYEEKCQTDADNAGNCEDFILVQSVVNWKDGNDNRELMLEEILSNWKGGAT